MKKRYIAMAAISTLCACEPVEEDGSFDPISITAEAVSNGFSFKQYDKDGNEAADGNYFKYVTNPGQIVEVFNYKDKEKTIENQLAVGASGSFAIAPGRGSDANQEFYVRVLNTDGTYSVATKVANVFVKQDLTTLEKLFVSNSGSKKWMWNTGAADGVVWGNMGYCGGNGADVYTSGAGKWWGVIQETDEPGGASFDAQLQHSVAGTMTGEESLNAYMIFTEDGEIKKYDGNGQLLNTTSFEVVDQTDDSRKSWAPYILKTGENSVLWPFEINAGGKYVTEFEVVYLAADAMTLVYPDGGDFSSLGNWGEATFWQFKGQDAEGFMVGVDGNGKSWTWNTDCPNGGVVWGNMGYCGGNGADVYTSGAGKWWGVIQETDEPGGASFDAQLQHSVAGAMTGEESMDAYMTFTDGGEVMKYDAEGKLLNTTTFKLEEQSDDSRKAWAPYILKTGENSILWPYEINAGGKYVTEYEVVYISNDAMTLVYPDGGDFSSLGNWGEASFWQFKAKK